MYLCVLTLSRENAVVNNTTDENEAGRLAQPSEVRRCVKTKVTFHLPFSYTPEYP